MRLIDADKLIEQGWRLERHGQSNELVGVMSLADVPTAFNVEEVINVVREAGAKLCANKSCNNNCDCCAVDDALRDIIDAVRKGGVK